ncbi:SDR family oxidoreductase [Marinomonas posidonica]|uniref:Short-chain dehydrogenase/reductase SDR n=1 Tax=Marinomonas posidonica (strain CECT 7376 / NCIMB 14433 / IVIA-Po-181) TaxID=491952 RepID=F6CV41_MARPP|nr:SDR family oxidoreductase [Marinomonas posidonica]AEF56461.1 short-chain dehydrogenase/reductase SDR [Marinomonas posidonica IVIA-Po-181]
MKIQDSHFILTGASGGIGRAIAMQLASAGASLTLVGRRLEPLETLLQSLNHQENHRVLVADIASAEGIATITDYARQAIVEQRRINGLINNAGCNDFALLSSKQPHQIEQEIRLNLLAPIMLCQSLVDLLSQPGVILNIGSTFGSIGYPGYTTYCAAKAGLHRFTEALDRELNGSGIRALYLAPRATDTALNSHAVNQLNHQLGNAIDSPEYVAKHVQAVLEKEISAKWIGWPEKLFARINQIFPNMVSTGIHKQHTIIHQYIHKMSQERRCE